jgi:hypothetical protein
VLATATPFKNSVVIGHGIKPQKSYRCKTTKIKIERQRKGIDVVDCRIKRRVKDCVGKSFDESMRRSAFFLTELIALRDNLFSLPDEISLAEVDAITQYQSLCVS